MLNSLFTFALKLKINLNAVYKRLTLKHFCPRLAIFEKFLIESGPASDRHVDHRVVRILIEESPNRKSHAMTSSEIFKKRYLDLNKDAVEWKTKSPGLALARNKDFAKRGGLEPNIF